MIQHEPVAEPREPAENDIETFQNLSPGDSVSFFEWPVEPLTVVQRETDEHVGERVRVEAAGSESFLYEVDGRLWHYVEEEPISETNPYPVQNLTLKDDEEA